MGNYINIGNAGFLSARNGEYVDKSGLIPVVNATLDTKLRFSCVSRCRRFGKSMAAEMLCAYYDRSCDSRSLFSDLAVSKDPDFEKHLNKYPVLYLDMTSFVTRFKDEGIVKKMDAEIVADVRRAYPEVPVEEGDDLMEYLLRVHGAKNDRFFFIIDEWDAICREFKADADAMDAYLDWLRRMFKNVNSNSVFVGVYMTGILPVKKYKTQSALNNFTEYSMVDPRRMASYFGFTKDEVLSLATKSGMDYDDLEKWYDGYQIGSEMSMFNPNSVMQALDSGWCTSYWGKTATYDVAADYIKMNFDGLKDDVVSLLAGGRVRVNPSRFQNDMSIIETKDDVLTVLIHLGYLSFDRERSECYVPNYEVAGELSYAVENTGWTNVVNALKQSHDLLLATLEGDEEAVAKAIDAAHDDNTSILSYNNENSLACVLSIAYYSARKDYVMYRELPSGKGFADIVLLPRKNVPSPAVVLELKYDKDADSATRQILRRQYPAKLAQYGGDVLLVGVNYDKQTKKHSCRIVRQTIQG